MGKNLKNEKLSFYKKKRNQILFFLTSFLIIAVAIFFILLSSGVDSNILLGIYFVLAIVYLGVLLVFRVRFNIYNTYYQYLLMIENKRPPYQLSKKLYTENWLKDIQNTYQLDVDNNQYQLYSTYVKKSHTPYFVKQTLVVVVVAKDPGFDFYSDDINHEIEKFHLSKLKIRRQIVLQFKRYEHLDDVTISEIEQIINYKEGQNQIIHVTAGYSDKENKLYFLEPQKRYPSKYYLFTCQTILALSYISE